MLPREVSLVFRMQKKLKINTHTGSLFYVTTTILSLLTPTQLRMLQSATGATAIQ